MHFSRNWKLPLNSNNAQDFYPVARALREVHYALPRRATFARTILKSLLNHSDVTNVNKLGERVMSCWVVPSIAAEIWGVTVDQIIEGMKAGQIPSKSELGRTFVDVAPDSPVMESPKPAGPRPATYTVVTEEEQAALQGDLEDDTIDLGDWREAREGAEKRRRPPLAA